MTNTTNTIKSFAEKFDIPTGRGHDCIIPVLKKIEYGYEPDINDMTKLKDSTWRGLTPEAVIQLFKDYTSKGVNPKEQVSEMKISHKDILLLDGGIFGFDSRKIVRFDGKTASGENAGKEIFTGENALTREFSDRKILIVNLKNEEPIGIDSNDKEEAIRQKKVIFSQGLIDIASGEKYGWVLQNPSGNRKANFIFIQMRDEETVEQLIIKVWLKLSGFNNFDELMHSDLFEF